MVTFSYDTITLPPPTTVISTCASVAATAVLVCTIANDYVPEQLQSFFSGQFKRVAKTLTTQLTVVVDEFNGLTPNHVFDAANTYLSTKLSSSTRRINASKSVKESDVTFSIDVAEEVVDWFDGVKVTWILLNDANRGGGGQAGSGQGKKRGGGGELGAAEMRFFELRFHKKHRDLVLSRY